MTDPAVLILAAREWNRLHPLTNREQTQLAQWTSEIVGQAVQDDQEALVVRLQRRADVFQWLPQRGVVVLGGDRCPDGVLRITEPGRLRTLLQRLRNRRDTVVVSGDPSARMRQVTIMFYGRSEVDARVYWAGRHATLGQRDAVVRRVRRSLADAMQLPRDKIFVSVDVVD